MRPFSAHLLLCQEIQVRKIKRVDSLTARDMDTIPIKRVDKLTNAEFLESYRNKRPVIISDVAANWKAVALWKDPAYLKEKVGAKRADEKFPVFVAPDNLRFLAKGADIEPMTLNELIDRVFSDNSEGKKRLYLRGPPLNEVMSDLDPEPAFVLDKNEHFSERMSGVWIGMAGNITPIHFDMWHGILTQIVGDKKVAMFHPDESNLLYPHSSLTANPHTSQVDLREWDQDPAVRSKYPKMQHATKYTAVLRPGDSLYIPPCWWHDVESLDNCISYTTRWEIGTRESIHPAAIK